MYDDVICQIPVDEISGEKRLLKRLIKNHTYQTTSLSNTFEKYIITPSGKVTYADYQPVVAREDVWNTCGYIHTFSGEIELQTMIVSQARDYIVRMKAVIDKGQLINHYNGLKLQLLECREIKNIDRINSYKKQSARDDEITLMRSKITYKIKTFFEKMNFMK